MLEQLFEFAGLTWTVAMSTLFDIALCVVLLTIGKNQVLKKQNSGWKLLSMLLIFVFSLEIYFGLTGLLFTILLLAALSLCIYTLSMGETLEKTFSELKLMKTKKMGE